MNNILRNVLMRRSTTQFDSRPILDEAMIEILEEGKILSNAPSNQEWHFTVLQNRDLLRRFHVLYERLVEEKRFNHILRVEKAAIELAERYGADVYKARAAALLVSAA